ncbi:hypothetical protein ABFY81_15615 [Acinetobacter sp. WA-87]
MLFVTHSIAVRLALGKVWLIFAHVDNFVYNCMDNCVDNRMDKMLVK